MAFSLSLGQYGRLQEREEAWTCGKFYESWEVVATVENFVWILIAIVCKGWLLNSLEIIFDGESRNTL